MNCQGGPWCEISSYTPRIAHKQTRDILRRTAVEAVFGGGLGRGVRGGGAVVATQLSVFNSRDLSSPVCLNLMTLKVYLRESTP